MPIYLDMQIVYRSVFEYVGALSIHWTKWLSIHHSCPIDFTFDNLERHWKVGLEGYANVVRRKRHAKKDFILHAYRAHNIILAQNFGTNSVESGRFILICKFSDQTFI